MVSTSWHVEDSASAHGRFSLVADRDRRASLIHNPPCSPPSLKTNLSSLSQISHLRALLSASKINKINNNSNNSNLNNLSLVLQSPVASLTRQTTPRTRRSLLSLQQVCLVRRHRLSLNSSNSNSRPLSLVNPLILLLVCVSFLVPVQIQLHALVGLFGASTNQPQQQQQQQQSAPLFGNTQPTTSAFGGFGASTIGQQNQQPTSFFGQAAQQQTQQQTAWVLLHLAKLNASTHVRC